MKKAIEYNISGIKCDAKGCDYNDESVNLIDYEKWLNKPCPKCGGNLLTEADFKATQAIIAACNWVNSLGLKITDEARTKIKVEMGGSGIPSIKEVKTP